MSHPPSRKACVFVLCQTAIVLLAACGAHAGEDPEPLRKAVSELLDMRAPAPDWREHLGMKLLPPENGQSGERTVPRDDAPSDFLVGFRSQFRYRDDHPDPSQEVRKRLLEACLANPEYFSELLDFIPDDPGSHAAISRAIIDAAGDPEWKNETRRRLMLRSAHFRLGSVVERGPAALARVRGESELRA